MPLRHMARAYVAGWRMLICARLGCRQPTAACLQMLTGIQLFFCNSAFLLHHCYLMHHCVLDAALSVRQTLRKWCHEPPLGSPLKLLLCLTFAGFGKNASGLLPGWLRVL